MKKLKLPDELQTISVSYTKYNVKFVDQEYSEANGFLGILDTEKQQIKIRDSLHNNELINTLFHELFHACNFHFGMKTEYGSELEEKFVECIANGFTEIIVKNPELLKWIDENIER